jgi:hypothetical protein
MWLLTLASLAVILLILMEGFETMVLPRQVTRRYRMVRYFYRGLWVIWRTVALRLPRGKLREAFLSRFGPLSLLLLLATWVAGLIVGFALLSWSLGITLQAPEKQPDFVTYLYWSGVTFFTLGYGEVVPLSAGGRVLAVVEAGVGFGFMAIIIGYLPVLYQAFSRREATIGLLDARAGSPPSAAQWLLRLGRAGNLASVDGILAEWERWSAELLESHLSFPVLSFYRSQHDNQSWLAALTAMLDACALLLVGVKGNNPYQAQLTFAAARHAAVDLALVFRTPPLAPEADRLGEGQLRRLRQELHKAGLDPREGAGVDAKLCELRGMYEPFVNALARYFLLTLPAIDPEPSADNWQRSAWLRRAPGIGSLPVVGANEEHL